MCERESVCEREKGKESGGESETEREGEGVR